MVAKREKLETTPDDIKNPDGLVNPSSNMIARNPTRIDLSNEADDQREIVDAIKESQAKRMKVIYEYKRLEDNEDGTERWEFSGLPGLVKIHEMNEDQLVEFCRTLMRCKPNITGVSLTLGEYENLRPYSGPKINKLNFRKPRYPTEVAEDWASLLGDKTLCVVKVDWQVKSAGAGAFETIGHAWVTDSEQFEDRDKFAPTLEIEYFSR